MSPAFVLSACYRSGFFRASGVKTSTDNVTVRPSFACKRADADHLARDLFSAIVADRDHDGVFPHAARRRVSEAPLDP